MKKIQFRSRVQELMTAAMGHNTALIADPAPTPAAAPSSRRPRGPAPPPVDTSDLEALTAPSFAVTQALVGLLAKSGGYGLTRASSLTEAVKGQLPGVAIHEPRRTTCLFSKELYSTVQSA